MSNQPTAEPCCQVCGVPWTEHVGVQVLCKALEAAKAENERLRSGLSKVRGLVEQAVITEGDNAGVLLQSCESTTHYDHGMQCFVFDNECFSPMGELLVDVANKIKTILSES